MTPEPDGRPTAAGSSPPWPGFTPAEMQYIGEFETARLGTIDRLGRPHVVPVGYHFESGTGRFVVGGPHLLHTAKYRHVASGRVAVALAIDDRLRSGLARGIVIHGKATLADEGGRLIHPQFPPAAIWIVPTTAHSWRVNKDD